MPVTHGCSYWSANLLGFYLLPYALLIHYSVAKIVPASAGLQEGMNQPFTIVRSVLIVFPLIFPGPSKSVGLKLVEYHLLFASPALATPPKCPTLFGFLVL